MHCEKRYLDTLIACTPSARPGNADGLIVLAISKIKFALRRVEPPFGAALQLDLRFNPKAPQQCRSFKYRQAHHAGKAALQMRNKRAS